VRLIKNYDCIIDYHPGKANDVADALNLKINLLCMSPWIGIKRNELN
jgi:hypothetical protein